MLTPKVQPRVVCCHNNLGFRSEAWMLCCWERSINRNQQVQVSFPPRALVPLNSCLNSFSKPFLSRTGPPTTLANSATLSSLSCKISRFSGPSVCQEMMKGQEVTIRVDRGFFVVLLLMFDWYDISKTGATGQLWKRGVKYNIAAGLTWLRWISRNWRGAHGNPATERSHSTV